LDFVLGQNKAAKGVGDRCSGEDCDGVKEVVRFEFVAAGLGENFFDVVGPEIFSTGRFGGLQLEIGIAKEVGEKFTAKMALLCHGGVLVIAPAAVGEELDQGIDEHVARTGVEREDVLRFGVGGDDGDVGDPADVEADAI